jgi:acyl-CoA thioesterase FadM
MTRQRRRLVETAARLVDPGSGELLATAQAVYVAADEERKRQLKERYRFRLVADSSEGGAR